LARTQVAQSNYASGLAGLMCPATGTETIPTCVRFNSTNVPAGSLPVALLSNGTLPGNVVCACGPMEAFYCCPVEAALLGVYVLY
jgi:hypothetical protein